VLGRVSNLPTVWSNCLAAWLLGGGGRWQSFALLCLGAILLYTGGMFLNDAFDVEFDRQYRSERPIIAGHVSAQFVWIASAALLSLGWLALLRLGFKTAAFGGLLLLCIVAYNAVHKRTQFAPLLMASCRFLLYLVSASAAHFGASRSVVWSALALFCYIVGLSYIARVESTGAIVSRWPTVLLFLPLLVTFIFGAHAGTQFWIAAVAQPLWVFWCLTGGLPPASRFLSSGVAGLLAGIPLVDWLAAGSWPGFGLTFPICFLMALILQRVAPAT
jgi:4-hydroxybenzoate polyprenyltransferase